MFFREFDGLAGNQFGRDRRHFSVGIVESRGIRDGCRRARLQPIDIENETSDIIRIEKAFSESIIHFFEFKKKLEKFFLIFSSLKKKKIFILDLVAIFGSGRIDVDLCVEYGTGHPLVRHFQRFRSHFETNASSDGQYFPIRSIQFLFFFFLIIFIFCSINSEI